MPFDVVYDYSYDGIMRSFEDSLQRLGLARIDILYVHDIGAMQHGGEAHPKLMRTLRDGGYRALEELRSAGTVRAIGIGVNEREALLESLEWGDWDAFLLAGRYTLLEQAPLDDLLPKCLKAGTSVVVGGPLNSGILAGRDTWNYKTAPPEIVTRVNAIEAVCAAHRVPLAAAALQFPSRIRRWRDHSRPAQCRGIPRQSGLLRHPIRLGCGRTSRRWTAPPKGADASLTREGTRMRCGLSAIASGGALLVATLGSAGASAQKSGGILKMPDFASSASKLHQWEQIRGRQVSIFGQKLTAATDSRVSNW
jgi:hypothetical protein